MAELGPDRLAYVDRRNNVLKLAQGEFVAIARLEPVFTSAALVRQVFIYGNSERPYLLAVVVPTDEALEKFAHDADGLEAALSESFRQTAELVELQTYEVPADFLIDSEPFSADNGLLSGVTTLGAEGYRSYDVMNPHDDGISLDVFVDWLNEAGHDIRRIDDYDEWLGRFETALRALPDMQRQQSVLPLLNAYRTPEAPLRGAPAPTDVFRAAVQEAKIGAYKDIPHLSAALIDKYVTDLQLRGLL